MTALQTIDLDQLALITGGQGRFERVGEQVGGAVGRWGAGLVPRPYRPVAQAVLPPVGRAVGGEIGRRIDGWVAPPAP